MLILAIALFMLTATFGIAILVAILQDRFVNKITLSLHGVNAVIAIGLMFSYVILYGGSPLLMASLITFITTALGGLPKNEKLITKLTKKRTSPEGKRERS